MSQFWVNGKLTESFSIADRGLQYGDGFFTTVAVYNHSLLNWSAHWWRIEQSCTRLNQPLPERNEFEKSIAESVTQYLTKHSVADCILKIIITRGEGGLGYQAPAQVSPNVLFLLKSSNGVISVQKTEAYGDAITLGLCDTKASINDQAGLKTLNRLDNVMARTELAEKGFDEGIMLNHNGNVVCGTQSNLFVIKGGVIYTPKLNLSGVYGTCRFQLEKVLQTLGKKFEETDLSLSDIEDANELFFTNAVRGIQPVREYLGKSLEYEQSLEIQKIWNQWQLDNATPLNSF